MEDKTIEDLKKEVEELKQQVERISKTMIVIVGDFDGTNVPVTVNGVRRKIATTAP